MKLEQRNAPYWCVISPSLALGYRKGTRGGIWSARFHDEETGKRLQTKIGTADDTLDADGVVALNFWQAQEATRKWRQETANSAARAEQGFDCLYTVADAMSDYLKYYAAERKGFKVVNAITSAHILPNLGHIRLDRLGTKQLQDWFYGIASSPARLRTKNSALQKYQKLSNEVDDVRRRRSTANRILTVLKAALNYAWRQGKVLHDTEWRKIKPFRNVNTPIVRFLSEEQCVRLVNACDEELRLIIQAALFTGCRYGEIARMVVSDFSAESGTVTVQISKSGKPRAVYLTVEGMRFFRKTIALKNHSDLIFTRANGDSWGKSHPNRPLHLACKNAAITPEITFHILRHTHASILAMNGVPIQVIAKQLGHSDTRITEIHYAHLGPSYVADTIRDRFPTLGILGENNLVTLKPKKNRISFHRSE